MIGQRSRFADRRWPTPWPQMDIIERQSIAYRLALVAAGQGDATVLFGFKHDWDVAAGAALVEAAGGKRQRSLGRAARVQPARSARARRRRRWRGAAPFANRAHTRLPRSAREGVRHARHERTATTPAPRHRRRTEGARPAGIRRSRRGRFRRRLSRTTAPPTTPGRRPRSAPSTTRACAISSSTPTACSIRERIPSTSCDGAHEAASGVCSARLVARLCLPLRGRHRHARPRARDRGAGGGVVRG